jgi:hypothetical protein
MASLKVDENLPIEAAALLLNEPMRGALWIVSEGTVRIHN